MKKLRLSAQILCLLFIPLACTNQSSPGKKADPLSAARWQVIGPGGGGGVLKPTVSPFNKNFVLTHCDMTGAYISHNGGTTWTMKNLCNVPDDFEFDPLDSNTVYIATRGFLHSEDRGSGISLLLRSGDMGETWQILYPDISISKKVEKLQSTSTLPSEIINGALDGTIQKVEVDPFDNNRIYLGIAPLIDYMGGASGKNIQKEVTLALSVDRGKTWNEKVSLPGTKVLALFAGLREGYIIVFTDKGCSHINKTTGDHQSFSLPVNDIIAIEGGRSAGGSLIYLQSPFHNKGKGGMYVSRDFGENWQQINNGLTDSLKTNDLPDFRQGLTVCESVPEVSYVSIDIPRRNSKGEFDPLYCIYKTSDAGKSWKPVLVSSSYEGYISKNFDGSWMEKSYDPGWGGNPIDMGVAPGNPEVCYAGDNGRGYKTTDGGKSWIQIYSHNNSDGSFTSSGLDVTTCYGIHFDPFDKDHFFICYTDIGLFHTYSGGKSWFHSIRGIPFAWQNTCYEVVFDPDIKGKIWSVWANAHDLPRTKMFGSHGFEGYEGGVALSMDGGLTWEKCNNGLPANSVCTNILLDTSSLKGKRTLYVSVFSIGIYKSTDDGHTWNPSNDGLGSNLFAWQIRKNSKGRLFALFSRGLSGGKVVDGAIYYSDNKASSWDILALPDSVNGPHDLLVDPVNPATMYVSCWPRTMNGNDIKGGVIKTADGGITWKQIFDERIRVNSAGMDPQKPNLIYINTFQNSAYRSENAGETWDRIEGYRFKWGQRAVPDINNPGMLYLTTYGGSVFYGPEKGIPGAQDDITNIPDGWW
jgi:photosystem II stability/assembly factor-like uncharacterized protein